MEKIEELEEKEQCKELAKAQCGKDKLLQKEDSVLCEQAEQIYFPSDLIRAKNNFRDTSDLLL